ncbi:MAG: hypothetical protein WC488_03795 [Candidatus Micrarchaeia archaeon]
MEFKTLCGIIAVLSIAEALLILAGFAEPLSTYSPINVVFSLLGLLIVFYFAWASREALIETAKKSGIAGALSTIVFILASFLSKATGHPVFGISTGSDLTLWILFLVNILVNAAIFAVVGSVSHLLSGKMRKKN